MSVRDEWLTRLAVRPMSPGDAEAVAGLAGELGYPRTVAAIGDWIATVSGSGDQAAFVAGLDERIVGWVEVSIQRRLQSEPFALIGGLVVSEQARSRGVGRRLIREAEQWSRERGVHKVRATSRSSRARAHHFYLREGYLETKTSLVFEKTVGS